MAGRCPLYVELCAGSFAVGLRLLGIARPPIAFMGAKTSMASIVLRAMGLQPGQGADAVVLVDAGPWGHVWGSLLDPECAHQVAQILRGWSREEPRKLWDRLAATTPADPDLWDPQAVASYLWVQGRSCSVTPVWPEEGEWRMCRGGSSTRSVPAVQRNAAGLSSVETVAERIEAVAAWLVLQGPPRLLRPRPGAGAGGQADRRGEGCRADHDRQPRGRAGDVDDAAGALAQRGARGGRGRLLEDGGDPYPSSPPTKKLQHGDAPPRLDDVARRLEEVAAWLFRAGNSWRGAGLHWRSSEEQPIRPGRCQITQGALAERVEALAHGPLSLAAVLRCDVATLQPPEDIPPGTRVYIDPPYRGRTGYGYDLPRDPLLEVARAWADRGALVCVSEAEPLPLPGWHSREITPIRRWASRKGKRDDRRREFLTMNQPLAAPIEAPQRQLLLEEVVA